MENIDNMGKNSLEALKRSNLSEKARKRLTFEIITGAISLVLLATGLIFSAIKKDGNNIISQLMYFVGFLIEGVPIIVKGIKGIFTKNLTNTMEILVAIAIVACAFNKELILALLIPLILNVVHLLEERSIMGGRDVINGLKKMQQNKALLFENGQEKLIDAKEVKVGDIIIVKPGSGVPCDGVVVDGKSHIDQKSLTGEPQPAFKKTGDNVYAGTMNLEGKILVRVEKEFVDTSFSQILKLLEKSENMSVPESRLMDKFLGYYIPFVLGIALAVAIITRDISKFIAVLVVSCPCGQMLVSSAPMIASLGVATKRGILIKNSKFIEDLTDTNTIVFDKTGTVTKGELSLVKILPFEKMEENQVLTLAYSLAQSSNHPVSKAISDYCSGKTLNVKDVTNFKETPGGGIEGHIASVNGLVRLGNYEWLTGFGCKIQGLDDDKTIGSKSYVAVGNKIIGCVVLSDTVRDDAKTSIQDLKEMGIEKVVMLTGDNSESAEMVGKNIGADEVYARLLPQDKSAKIKEIAEDNKKVVAVGDGVNDALALRTANVGISMGAMGADLAIESSDIALMNNNLSNIPFVIHLSKVTKKIIYQNMALSIFISVFMMVISVIGLITPLMGAILHNIGAFSVLINSSRLMKLKSVGDNNLTKEKDNN